MMTCSSLLLAGLMAVQGYQLDISRSKVPTMASLHRIVDILAALGYNQFQLYTEHTFAYSRHRTVWENASPMTSSEVRELDAYCAARGIELVPNQNSFGHLEQWFRHPEYNGLAEAPLGGTTCGTGYTLKFPMCLNPTDPRSVEFLANLYDELFPCFRSKLVNVGCDETMELLDDHEPRLGRSAAVIREKGPHQVYVDFLNRINALCAARGHRIMYWGDIILQHPEFLPQLPRDSICLNWGYEANHPFEQQTAALEKSGRAFYVCPSTTSHSSLVGRYTNMAGTIDNCLRAGARHGAAGVLMTDWGNTGHPHPWVVSLPSLVYLSLSRRGSRPSREAVAAEVDRLAGAHVGEALITLGDLYLVTSGRAVLEAVVRRGKDFPWRPKEVSDEQIVRAVALWHEAMKKRDLTGAPDWVKEDFALLDLYGEMLDMRLAEPNAKNFRGRFEPRYRALWLKQNRPGGLERSMALVFAEEYP